MSTQPQKNIIKIANPPLEDNSRTYLTANVAAIDSSTNITILDKRGFLTTDRNDEATYYAIVGDYGEKSEIVTITSDNTVNKLLAVAKLKSAHSASDPVTFIPYNQIQLFGATETGGAKTLLDTVEIDATQNFTEVIYEDDGSNYTHFYTVYRFFVSEGADDISAYSEEIDNTDFGRTSAKRVITSATKKALTTIDESPSSKLNWNTAIEIVNDGLDEIMARKRKWLFLHKLDSTSTDTVAGTASIAKLSDIAILEHIIVNNTTLTWISRLDYDNYVNQGSVVTNGNPFSYTLKNNLYYLYPTPNVAWDVTYEYFKYPSEITNLNDTLDVAFISILVYYCASQFAYIRGNDKRGDKMYGMFEKLLQQQVEEFSGPDQLGDAESIEKTSIYGSNLDFEDLPTYYG